MKWCKSDHVLRDDVWKNTCVVSGTFFVLSLSVRLRETVNGLLLLLTFRLLRSRQTLTADQRLRQALAVEAEKSKENNLLVR